MVSGTAVHREFDVAVGLAAAWERLADVERWPEWAPHIRSVTVTPAGPLGPTSSGTLRIRRLGRSTFTMSAWEPLRRWEWISTAPGFRLYYDHSFQQIDNTTTRLSWTVRVDGPLASVARPVFSRVYGRIVDRAIPRAQRWIAE